jgi:lysozyme
MTPAGLAQLKADEGLRLQPYTDTNGNLSIGYGRNLRAKGITAVEAVVLLNDDVAEVTNELSAYLWYTNLDPVRQDVLINMAYNLGPWGLLGFHQMIAALEAGNTAEAAAQIEASAAAKELPARYGRLRDAMKTGSWG